MSSDFAFFVGCVFATIGIVGWVFYRFFRGVGRNSSQPIRVRSIDGEYLYLSHLLDAGGEPVQALRRGSMAVPGFRKPVDWWSIQSEGRNYTDLYLYGYGEVVDLKTIANFQFDNPRAVLEE